MAVGSGTRVILWSLAANLSIAVVKGVAAFFTRSGAMMAEAVHSTADALNQVFLLIGVREAQKPATHTHPFGRGRAAYFWSFMVALMIFFGGGVVAIREGIHKWGHPNAVQHVWVGYVVLSVAMVLEGLAWWQVVRALQRRRGETPFFRFLIKSKDAHLVVLFAEDSAAMLGLITAFFALLLTQFTGDARWDALGSVLIGVILCAVAVAIAIEVKSLMEGESAAPVVEQTFRELVSEELHVRRVLSLQTLQQGPEQVVVSGRLSMSPQLSVQAVVEVINRLESRLKESCPEVRWIFLEPDNLGSEE